MTGSCVVAIYAFRAAGTSFEACAVGFALLLATLHLRSERLAEDQFIRLFVGVGGV